MSRYVRVDDRIITSDKATHKLTQDIRCAGYSGTLNKGAYVRIGKEWTNYYGHWVDIISERGLHYSIRPDEVKNVTEELPQSDIIEELFDTLVYRKALYKFYNLPYGAEDTEVYGAIWNDKGLSYVAKMNEEGDWVLL